MKYIVEKLKDIDKKMKKINQTNKIDTIRTYIQTDRHIHTHTLT